MACIKSIISPYRIFFVLSITSVFVGFVWIMATNGDAWNTTLFLNENDYFMDFYNHIRYVNSPSEVYYVSVHACFPAFAYLIYYALNRLIPSEYTSNSYDMRYSQYGNMVFLIYMLFITLIFVFAAAKYLKINETEKLLCIAALIFTAPFLYMFERGNIAYLASALLIIFLILYESENPLKRELAIFCLAAAAGLKIYPALFGFLYIKEKRFKEALRAVAYGIAIFLLPFSFFGGFSGFKQFVDNITEVNEVVWREGCLNSLVHTTILIGYKLGVSSDTAALVKTGKILSVIYFVVLITAAYFQKSRWKTLALLSAIMIWFPMWSGSYTMSYMCIPLLAFVNESRMASENRDYVYAFLFVGIFSLIVADSSICTKLSGYQLTVVLRYTSMLLIVFIIVCEQVYMGIKTIIDNRRRLNCHE